MDAAARCASHRRRLLAVYLHSKPCRVSQRCSSTTTMRPIPAGVCAHQQRSLSVARTSWRRMQPPVQATLLPRSGDDVVHMCSHPGTHTSAKRARLCRSWSKDLADFLTELGNELYCGRLGREAERLHQCADHVRLDPAALGPVNDAIYDLASISVHHKSGRHPGRSACVLAAPRQPAA